MPKLHHALFTLALAGIASTLAQPTRLSRGGRKARATSMQRREPLASRTLDGAILVSRYGGPLYQVKRADGQLLNIGVIAGGEMTGRCAG